jgi:hypothetical protein
MSLPLLNGFSGSAKKIDSGFSTSDQEAGMNAVVAALDKYRNHGFNCWRIASNPSWISEIGEGTRPWDGGKHAQSFLNKTASQGYYLVIDRNHLSPPATTTEANWVRVKNDLLTLLADPTKSFGNNPRVIAEIINENNESSSVYHAHVQTVITAIRNAGYTNWILQNNQWQSWQPWTDSLNKVIYGHHQYMDLQSLSQITSRFKSAISAGCVPICSTEIGASASEPSGSTAYTAAQTQQLADLLAWSNREGASPPSQKIGSLIWLTHYTTNLDNYEASGLASWLPYYGTTPPPKFTLRLSSNKAGVPWTIDGVPNKPAGEYLVNQGASVTLTVPNQVII